MATWSNTSRISSRVTPLLSDALTCNFSSFGRFSALIIAMLMRLRSRRARPGRAHTPPHQTPAVFGGEFLHRQTEFVRVRHRAFHVLGAQDLLAQLHALVEFVLSHRITPLCRRFGSLPSFL